MTAEKYIAISNDVVLPAYIHVTPKANGSLEIGNIVIKACDVHLNASIYQDYLLRIKMIDMDMDGCRDLIVYGCENILADSSQWPPPVVGSRLLFFLFLYNPDEGEFEFTYTNILPAEYDNYLFSVRSMVKR